MANFNLADYETVQSRIKRFYEDHPRGRITTHLEHIAGDLGKTRWVVKASVWRGDVLGAPSGSEQPDGTGYAFENDGQGMANQTSALENCETSAIGRALANIGYSGDKRASREETAKTQRATVQPPAAPTAAPPANESDAAATDEWLSIIATVDSLTKLEATWKAIGASGMGNESRLIRATNARKKELQNASV